MLTGDIGLIVSDLAVDYSGVPAVRGISFDVPAGHAIGLIGPNGAGKSSTLLGIMGAVTRQGTVQVNGQDVGGLSPEKVVRRGVSLVPEGRHIFGALSVRDNLRLGGVGRRSKDGYDDTLAYVLELFPILGEFADRQAGLLSGGQQQQLAIARALLGKPKLLLLDEPTEGIQPSVVLDIERAVRRIIEATGISVLLVEQHLHFVRQADRYYAMQRGGIVASGPTSELSKDVVDRFLTV